MIVLANGVPTVIEIGRAAGLPIGPPVPLVELLPDGSGVAPAISVTRDEYLAAIDRLAGHRPMPDDQRQDAWLRFAAVRASYDEALRGPGRPDAVAVRPRGPPTGPPSSGGHGCSPASRSPSTGRCPPAGRHGSAARPPSWLKGWRPGEVAGEISRHRSTPPTSAMTTGPTTGRAGTTGSLSIIEAVLLAVVALLAAYTGYASAKWGTESSVRLATASAARTEANRPR